MSLLDDWAVRLAKEIAPDEVELAPLIARDFASGDSEETLKPAEDLAGAFGLGETLAMFPIVLTGISWAGGGLVKFLAESKNLGELLGALKSSLSIFELYFKAAALDKEKRGKGSGKDPGRAARQAIVEVGNSPQSQELIKIIDLMSGRMRECGISGEKSDATTLRVLRALLEEPPEAAEFVSMLSIKRHGHEERRKGPRRGKLA